MYSNSLPELDISTPKNSYKLYNPDLGVLIRKGDYEIMFAGDYFWLCCIRKTTAFYDKFNYSRLNLWAV